MFGQHMEKEFSSEDWVLAFIRNGPEQDGESMIKGWLMFTKQFFVFVKEVRKDLDADFKFVPYDYGPYSFVLDDTVKNLQKQGYIHVVVNGDRKDFILTRKGCDRANEVLKKIPEKTRKTLSGLRRDATQLGYSGILRYVYSRYPEFTTASKIKGRVMGES